MKKQLALWTIVVLILALAAPAVTQAAGPHDLKLPTPQTAGGMPLMQALAARASSREFSDQDIPLQVLSNLLWAADGINRPEAGKRTAPSANNVQNIDIYAALKSGLYLYDAKGNVLKAVLAEDVRGATGAQEFVKTVPLDLVYVADMAKFTRGTDETKAFYSAAHVGFIAQNVYLFCASEGLATVVRGMVDKEALAKIMNLRPDQKVMLSQSVGYPKKS
jgi:SagB-type dehydrogenase family enzyme